MCSVMRCVKVWFAGGSGGGPGEEKRERKEERREERRGEGREKVYPTHVHNPHKSAKASPPRLPSTTSPYILQLQRLSTGKTPTPSNPTKQSAPDTNKGVHIRHCANAPAMGTRSSATIPLLSGCACCELALVSEGGSMSTGSKLDGSKAVDISIVSLLEEATGHAKAKHQIDDTYFFEYIVVK
ncbi:hypothetical protein BDN70DRAFT_901935, partial [Pholiota conissans]